MNQAHLKAQLTRTHLLWIGFVLEADFHPAFGQNAQVRVGDQHGLTAQRQLGGLGLKRG